MSLISDAKGETAALIASVDWLATPVGPPALWPQSLRTAVSLLMDSTFPMLLCWGPEFTQFYNDPFRRILGAAKHPAIGKSARVTFAETWHILGPLLNGVMAGDAVDHDDMFTPLARNGFLEECYFTYSYSPVRAEDDTVAGVLVTCTETTARVVGERRLRLIQELAAESTTADPECVCRRAVDVIARGAADLPFALLYLFDDERATLRYVAGTGLPGAAVIPAVVPLSAGTTAPWPLERSLAAGALIVDDDPSAPFGPLFVAPICATPGIALGVLVAGASSKLQLDDEYRGFVTLVAREIGASLAQPLALEHEKQRVASTADRARSTILVVDDDADMREGVARLLSDRWTVETAADGEAALAAARIGSPALVITGVVMPRLDGYALLRALRADASTRDIPVVLLSAHAGEEAHFEALEADANDYLVKPFSAGELRARVEAQLLRSEIRVAVEVRALIEARNEADAANRAKDQFLAVLGHELRAPLGPILTAVRLPELKGSPDADLQKLRQTIERQAQHMQRLIEDLLDVGRIISGKLRLEKDRVDLATLLEQAVEAASPAIERRQHTLTVVKPGNPVYVEVDAARFTCRATASVSGWPWPGRSSNSTAEPSWRAARAREWGATSQ
jgi:DNA-binding response OmpR family regulator